MPTVTRLAASRSDDDRLRVEVDGEAWGTLAAEAVDRLGLSVGFELSPSEADGLRAELDRQEALDRALRYLSYRPRSRAEVERHLRGRDLSEDAVAHALERCEALGYLDDREFAAAHARDRIRLKPRGKKVLEAELRKKGVDRETARQGIEDAFREEGVEERELLERVAEKRWRQMGSPGEEADPSERRRFAGYLKRRGFPFHMIREVTDRYFGELGAG